MQLVSTSSQLTTHLHSKLTESKYALLNLSEPRQAELALYCAAAKRFHKPVQPKSWFFNPASDGGYTPEEGDFVQLSNDYSEGYFIVLEVGDSASLCSLVCQNSFILDGVKSLKFGQAIKVMHDRMSTANHILSGQTQRHGSGQLIYLFLRLFRSAYCRHFF